MHCKEDPCLLLELAALLLQRCNNVQLASHAGLRGNAETAASLTHQSNHFCPTAITTAVPVLRKLLSSA